jgi:hypothetical protein
MPGALGLTLMAEDYGVANGSIATLKSADNHLVQRGTVAEMPGRRLHRPAPGLLL